MQYLLSVLWACSKITQFEYSKKDLERSLQQAHIYIFAFFSRRYIYINPLQWRSNFRIYTIHQWGKSIYAVCASPTFLPLHRCAPCCRYRSPWRRSRCPPRPLRPPRIRQRTGCSRLRSFGKADHRTSARNGPRSIIIKLDLDLWYNRKKGLSCLVFVCLGSGIIPEWDEQKIFDFLITLSTKLPYKTPYFNYVKLRKTYLN